MERVRHLSPDLRPNVNTETNTCFCLVSLRLPAYERTPQQQERKRYQMVGLGGKYGKHTKLQLFCTHRKVRKVKKSCRPVQIK